MANTAAITICLVLSCVWGFVAGFPDPLSFGHNEGGTRVARQDPLPGEELIFATRAPRQDPLPGEELIFATTVRPPVFINNIPVVATIAPFSTPTTASRVFLSCFSNCQTTPEYNPICASNMMMYFNEQKFNCAIRCGADIQIVRRGSCEGLFPMQRG